MLRTLLLYLLLLPAALAIDPGYIAPEHATNLHEKPLIYAAHQLVVSNNPWASEAANKILLQGGNATDAAIAAAFVLGLTEPQSSGIGGGGFALTYRARDKQLTAYDGRETAPASAQAHMFLDKNGQPLPFETARRSGKAVGVPGEVALLYALHLHDGKLPWSTLVQPAIQLADRGFPMSPRLHKLLDKNKQNLKQNPAVSAIYFTKSKQIKPIDSRIINHAYARTLKQVAAQPNIFYNGRIAQDIINTVNHAASRTLMLPADFKAYRVLKAAALCHPYREWSVCTTPFGSGGVSVLELLALFSHHPPITTLSVDWVYSFLEASKLAFADRNQYIADPKLMQIKARALLDKDYLNTRRQLITDTALTTPVAAGEPLGHKARHAADSHSALHGTTSLVIVDAAGNGISMTLSIEHEFGSQLFVDGFFLNNQLTDFSFMPTDKTNTPMANRVTANRRPRSAISPVLVFDAKQELTLLTGSPGGSAIICYVAKNLIQLLDLKFTPQQSAASGNLCALNQDPILEQDSELITLIPQLTQRGEVIQTQELVSGIVTIQRALDKPGWIGAADPRREGEAIGN